MPGIVGAFGKLEREEARVALDRMIAALGEGVNRRVERFVDPGGTAAAARVDLGVMGGAPKPLREEGGELLLLFHGELHHRTGSESDPDHVLKCFTARGTRCAEDLDGIFHFVVYDKRNAVMHLFSDRFGLHPLYYREENGVILFGSEVKAVLAAGASTPEPDYGSIADFFRFGQILGHKTLFESVRLLPPGSVLTADLKRGAARIAPYFRLGSLFPQRGRKEPSVSAEEVSLRLERAVRANCGNRGRLGLSLSGGLDSRGILAAMGEEAEGVHTYTLGTPGCADQRLSGRMAGICGTRHRFVGLDQGFLSDYETMAERMAELSDGMYPPIESTEMLALAYFKEAPFRVLLRGHGGEVAKAALAYPVMVDERAMGCASGSEILSWILHATDILKGGIDPARLFLPPFSRIIREQPLSSLEEVLSPVTSTLSPADICIYYYIGEHVRRGVGASLAIFRNEMEIRLPYMDRGFLEGLLKLPLSLRNRGEIHRLMIRRCRPELMKVPDSNTGAPPDAGPIRLFLGDRFNSAMKRLGIRGFRHYTEFGKWYRGVFSDGVRRILFSPPCRSRGLYDMGYLEEVFNLHVAGRRDYGRFLGIAVGLEMWFRRHVD